MATKAELFEKLKETGILLEDAKLSDFTKVQLTDMIDVNEQEEIEEKEIVIVPAPKPKFTLSDSFKPVYRINNYKRGKLPVIKVSLEVFSFVNAKIKLDDIKDTSVSRQLNSLVYYINLQPCRFITISPEPDKQYRVYVINNTLMIK